MVASNSRIRLLRETDREIDIDTLLAIEARSNPAPIRDTQLRDAFANDVNRTFVLCEQQAIIGFIIYQIAVDTADIVHLVIDQSQQGKGFAKQLLSKTLRQLQQIGVKTCFLEVRESNVTAHKLYEKCGFEVMGKRRNYYHSPKEHAVLMSRVLVLE